MKEVIKNSKVIIFDLDGTLYEDTIHFGYYARILKENLDEKYKKKFDEDYQKIKEGKHIVSIGRIYDVINDVVLETNPETMKVVNAWYWDGTSLLKETVEEMYQKPILCDLENMISIGDGWWLPDVCAKRYGLIDTYFAYLETKKYMLSEEFTLKTIKGLLEYLSGLKKSKKLILLTNSNHDDAIKILIKLGLEDVFEQLITRAKKPENTVFYFKKVIKEYGVKPNEVVSIGDNFLNEIHPAIKLGMETVFIDFFELEYATYEGLKVKSIGDLFD